jgi:hypothetical protein
MIRGGHTTDVSMADSDDNFATRRAEKITTVADNFAA